MREFTRSYLRDCPALFCSDPLFLAKFNLATCGDLYDNAGMPPDLMALFLLTGLFNAVTIATVMYIGFPRPETRFTLVVTLLLVYVREHQKLGEENDV